MTSRNPVLLIHGIWDRSRIFRQMSDRLSQSGWNVHTLDLIPNDGSAPLEKLATQLANYVAKQFPCPQSFDLVGFSMGGLISRYYIQNLGGVNQVQRFITISSPHHGTWTAYPAWGKGCEQMRPGSDFLNDLNQDLHILNQLNFTSIWTPFDAMIVPANSSHLPVGKEVVVPILTHAWMVRKKKIINLVMQALAEPLLINNLRVSSER